MNKEKISGFQAALKGRSAKEIVEWSLGQFGRSGIAFASSFGAEDQVITDILVKTGLKPAIFTLDTGRLPKETYELLAETRKHYGIEIEALHPNADAVEKMVKDNGPDLFYESIEKRKLCCNIRKVEPLKKKLASLKAWICGLRKEQSVTRTGIQKIEWDEVFGLFKINPLAEWTNAQVWDYIKNNNVPYNKLHDKGYPSIGCEPCTKAVKPGDDIRSGRWWWESKDSRECGLHIKKQD